jgi:hypothetical protein
LVCHGKGEGVVLQEDPQGEEIVVRVAALDIGKAELVCCVRAAGAGRRIVAGRERTTVLGVKEAPCPVAS